MLHNEVVRRPVFGFMDFNLIRERCRGFKVIFDRFPAWILQYNPDKNNMGDAFIVTPINFVTFCVSDS